jgi:precorrin-2 dehydrogenase / sirohydrochlorin ferrochelatase
MNSEPSTTEAEHTHAAKSRLYYPAFLILEGKLCAVVGGGRVATRKVHSLLAADARVVVISPALHIDLQTLLARDLIEHIPHNYTAEYLTGASFVFATTNDPEVNRQVAHDARNLRLLVNVADDPDTSDFHVPAIIYHQDLTLAIATGGGSPAFARYVREVIERSLVGVVPCADPLSSEDSSSKLS